MSMNWPDLYLRHFTRFLGKPFDVRAFHTDDGDSIRLATFDRRYPNYLVYASLGMSDRADVKGGVGEIILLSDDKRPDVPLIFLNSLLFIRQRRIPLGEPFAVGGIEMVKPDFVEYYGKPAIYYSPVDGFPAGFDQVQRLGDVGLVYQGLFISWPEQDFLNRNGPAAFEEKLRNQKNDPCSLRRPACVE